MKMRRRCSLKALEFVKKHGRERELTLYRHEKGWGESGQGTLMPLLEKAKKRRH